MDPHHAVHELDVVLATGRRHRDSIVERRRERLLAENVQPALGGLHRPLAVQGRGQGDVDGVEVRVVEQGVVGTVMTTSAMFPSPRFCASDIATRDRGEFRAGSSRDRRPDLPRDPAGAEDAESEGDDTFSHDS